MAKLAETFEAARLCGVPIIGVTTPDQTAVIDLLRGETGNDVPPVLQWDVMTGIRPLNDAAQLALLRTAGIDPDVYDPKKDADVAAFQHAVREQTQDPANALFFARRLPEPKDDGLGAVLFFCNAHLFLGSDYPEHFKVRQGIANLRDPYKGSHRMLVLLAPELSLPAELAQDVIVLDDVFPDEERLAAIVQEQFKGAGLPAPKPDVTARAVEALRGVAAFPAEQITAMSLRRSGLDLDALRERKYAELEKVGLKVDRERVTFASVGGKAQIKKLLRGVFTGRRRPGLVVRIDEGEKLLTTSPDSHEVSRDQAAVFLKEMEDNKYSGIIILSPPGVGKTLLSKAVAGEFGVMSVELDLGGRKSKWVGDSEANVRRCFKTIRAAAGEGGAFFILTCNRMESLAPEVRRRFTRGIWYDDLPTRAEKDTIWAIQQSDPNHKLPANARHPEDKGWTGADIRNCCEAAWSMNITLEQATEFMVPVSQSDPKSISALRTLAQESFLSTAYPGPYRGEELPLLTGEREGRKTETRKIKL